MLLISVALAGAVAGGLTVVLLSKNNKNTIAKARQEILESVAKGRTAVEEVLKKHGV